MTDIDCFSGGFADPPVDAARAFRSILDAMARPGRIVAMAGAAAPAPASPAAAAVLLTLADNATPVHLAGTHDAPALRDWMRFHTDAPIASRAAARFALGTWEALIPLEDYACGTPEYPDASATLVVELDRLEPAGARLSGPGIKTQAWLSLPDVGRFAANAARFPLGVDFILTCGDRLAALPRTTRVEAG